MANKKIKKVKIQPRVYIGDNYILETYDFNKKVDIYNGGFGFVLLSEEKENKKEPKNSDYRFYHDQYVNVKFKSRKNFLKFQKGLDLMQEALGEEDE